MKQNLETRQISINALGPWEIGRFMGLKDQSFAFWGFRKGMGWVFSDYLQKIVVEAIIYYGEGVLTLEILCDSNNIFEKQLNVLS